MEFLKPTLTVLLLTFICQGRLIDYKVMEIFDNYDIGQRDGDVFMRLSNISNFSCILKPSDTSRQHFRHMVYYYDLNFVNLQLNTGNDVTFNAPHHVIGEQIWTWTFYGEDGALEFLSWPIEFGIWSLGLLNNYVKDLYVTLMADSGNCTDLIVGDENVNIAISEALLQLVMELMKISLEEYEKYGPSFFCYKERMYIRPEWLYTLCKHIVCPLETMQYVCCTYRYIPEDGRREIVPDTRNRWHYDSLWWVGPIVVSLLLFAFMPLFLTKLSLGFSEKRTVTEEQSTPMIINAKKAPSFIFYNGEAQITLLNTLLSPLISAFPRVQSSYPRIIRLLLPVLSISVIGIQILMDNRYLKAFVFESVKKGAPMGFRSMLAGFHESSYNFLPYLGGPFVALSLYLIIASVFIVLPRSLSRHLETAIPSNNSNECWSPLVLDLKSKERFGSVSIRREHGLRKVHNVCLSQFFMLLNIAYWSNAIDIQTMRWHRFHKYKVDLMLLPVYITWCFVEHILCLLIYGLPAVFFSVILFRSYYIHIGNIKRSRIFGRFYVLWTCLAMCLLIVCLTLFLFMICIIFLDACLFLTRLFIFTFTGIVVYPKFSYGYLIFTLTVVYYLVDCIKDFSQKYTRILKLTISVCKNLQRANDEDLLIMKRGLFKGVRTDILEYVIERLCPKRKQAFLSLFKLSVVLGAIWVSLLLLTKTDKFRELQVLVHVSTALFTCAIPQLTKSIFRKDDGNIELKLLKRDIVKCVREMISKQTSFEEMGANTDSD